MKTILLLVIVITFTWYSAHAQQTKPLEPFYTLELKLTLEDYTYWKKAALVLDSIYNTSIGEYYDKLSKEQKTMVDLEDNGENPYCTDHRSVFYDGNNWLFTSNPISTPRGLYDFDLISAWYSQQGTTPLGQRFTLLFEPTDSKLRSISIFNGWTTEPDRWKSYSRTAKLKLWINDKEIGIIALHDSMSQQSFLIDTDYPKNEGEPISLVFEILAIYPGSIYQEVAISEINFTGTDIL